MAHKFNTPRLTVLEANNQLETLDLESIYSRIIEILSPEVVTQLPPYFSGIQTREDAKRWFERMLNESHLFLVYHKISKHLIGFSFISLTETKSEIQAAHLGYLLAQNTWGQGLASELICALITHCKTQNLTDTLIAGVDESNLASIALLKKLGFIQDKSDIPANLFFHYDLKI